MACRLTRPPPPASARSRDRPARWTVAGAVAAAGASASSRRRRRGAARGGRGWRAAGGGAGGGRAHCAAASGSMKDSRDGGGNGALAARAMVSGQRRVTLACAAPPVATPPQPGLERAISRNAAAAAASNFGVARSHRCRCPRAPRWGRRPLLCLMRCVRLARRVVNVFRSKLAIDTCPTAGRRHRLGGRRLIRAGKSLGSSP